MFDTADDPRVKVRGQHVWNKADGSARLAEMKSLCIEFRRLGWRRLDRHPPLAEGMLLSFITEVYNKAGKGCMFNAQSPVRRHTAFPLEVRPCSLHGIPAVGLPAS